MNHGKDKITQRRNEIQHNFLPKYNKFRKYAQIILKLTYIP